MDDPAIPQEEMMKKNVKRKLVLHRETLHYLASVTGGTRTYTYCATLFSGCDGA